jgi:hypothetical protein
MRSTCPARPRNLTGLLQSMSGVEEDIRFRLCIRCSALIEVDIRHHVHCLFFPAVRLGNQWKRPRIRAENPPTTL